MKNALKRTVSFAMMCTLLFFSFIMVFAEENGSMLPASHTHSTTKGAISLNYDFESTTYGCGVLSYKDFCISFYDGKIFVSSERRAFSRNINGCSPNLIGGNLYYISYENGLSIIHVLCLDNGKEQTILSFAEDSISLFYVVNNNSIVFQAGDGIYFFDSIDHKTVKYISAKNLHNFIPSRIGIIYSCEGDCGLTLYFENVYLINSINYYSVREDHLVFSIDDQMYQISLDKVAEYYNSSLRFREKIGSLIEIASEFDLYGIYDVAELLQLNDENRSCSFCEELEDEAIPVEYHCITPQRSGTEVTPTNAGKMILTQSQTLTTHSMTFLRKVKKYNSNNYFAANSTISGIPYARRKIFRESNDYTDYEKYVKTIVFDESLDPGESATWVNMSLASFTYKVGNASSKFYGTAAECAPLYGMDCSAFLSYCWGLTDRETTSTITSSTFCTQLSVSGSSSLGLLQVGDAVIKPEVHCRFISKIYVNSSGSITSIELTDEYPPKTREDSFTPSGFCQTFLNNGYNVYRCKTYKLTFNPQGGECSINSRRVVANIPYSYGYSLPVPTKSGFLFRGWYTQPTGGTLVNGDTVNTGSSMTLYAHWMVGSSNSEHPISE